MSKFECLKHFVFKLKYDQNYPQNKAMLKVVNKLSKKSLKKIHDRAWRLHEFYENKCDYNLRGRHFHALQFHFLTRYICI